MFHFIAVEVDQPPASSVRRFLALLEQSDIDFSEELGKTMLCDIISYLKVYHRQILILYPLRCKLYASIVYIHVHVYIE